MPLQWLHAEASLELLRANLRVYCDDIIYRQPCEFGMFATGLLIGRLKLTERVFSIRSHMTPYPLHPNLIAGSDDILANCIELFGSKRRQRTCNHEARH